MASPANNDSGEPESPHPAEEGNSTSQALQRAPTLIAGRTGGSGGLVQVWSPGNLALLGSAIPDDTVTIPFLFVSFMCFFPALFLGQAAGVPFGLLLGACGVGNLLQKRALLRPVCLVTDEEGMSVSYPGGSNRSIRWTDIEALELVGMREGIVPPYLALVPWAPEAMKISLVGFSKAQRERLLYLIAVKATLIKHPRQQGLWVRRKHGATSAAEMAPLPPWRRSRPGGA